ncbi:30S ribosomal protein S1 [Microaerobacter geothermalis]|uniref:30S ribosomal protein S1 n=1 Tax=Microaerobacter geothermalis TaxID=674972 RepID=UPI001F325CE5|nr:30S ribosomal protein S1 [Microaerobacter geothermalis]MCF6093522.1 30S ribosomal protein S1 [Microaerobacter geothermalis]
MVEEIQNELTEVSTLQVGDIVKGKVSKVEDKQALVDVGYKFDGVIPISEVSSLHIERVGDVLQEGDEVELKVIRLNDEKDELVLSKRAVDNEKAWKTLAEKVQNNESFDVVIADVVKGGLVVDLGVRAFIPASHVEQFFVEDFSDYKGRTLKVKIIELDQEKNKVILSHRAVLEEEAEQQKEKIFEKLSPGEVLEGTVQRLTDFGAFVDVGGVDGLVHISELSWKRVATPSEVVKEGDVVKVKVLKVDKENERISLSIKATLPGPWEEAGTKFKIGDVVKGTVKRLVSFGAFVEIAPGVEGLVHISQIANRHIGTPGEVLKEGQEVEAKIIDMNLAEKRISLSIKEVEQEKAAKVVEKHKEEYTSSGMGVTLGDVLGDKLRNLK